MGIGVIKIIVDKIVSETPLLCMPEDKQMQREYLEEKWLKWFKENITLTDKQVNEYFARQRVGLLKELKSLDLSYIAKIHEEEWMYHY